MSFPIQQISNTPGPKMPPGWYKTYQIAQPVGTHYRLATCAEVQCKAYLEGWTYKKSDLEAENLLYAVTHAGKRYREMSLTDSPDIYLVFEPGQACFQAPSHRVSLERPAFYFAGRGHYQQGYSHRRATEFDRPEDWVDSFATHQDIIRKVMEEGI
jgi:hypothetical protein